MSFGRPWNLPTAPSFDPTKDLIVQALHGNGNEGPQKDIAIYSSVASGDRSEHIYLYFRRIYFMLASVSPESIQPGWWHGALC